MSAPVAEASLVGETMALLVALPIGIAFGCALEQAGLGSAPKLAAQFSCKDLTVFKVMFTALVTAMLGTFWLAWAGWLDLARVHVPETYVAPQIAGGVVFGLGFSMSGLCPGTSCVSAATGRGDGAMVMLGLFAGMLAAGLALEEFRWVYESTARGVWTLPVALRLPYGVVVTAITGLALSGFAGAEWLERRRKNTQ